MSTVEDKREDEMLAALSAQESQVEPGVAARGGNEGTKLLPAPREFIVHHIEDVMALVWAQGETIVLAKSSSQSRTQILVVASVWDHPNACFVLSARMVIPVAADAELLTGGSVLDSETGLLRSYLVLYKGESIYIFGLDFDQEKADLIVKLPLPNSSLSTSTRISKCFIEECWITDGPIIVSVWRGQLLLITSKDSHRSSQLYDETEEDFESGMINTTWEAHLLSLPESSEQGSLKVHFCGDISTSDSQQVILSLTAFTGKRLRESSASPGRYSQSWSFYSLHLDTEGPIYAEQSSHGKGFHFTLSKQIPAELDPQFITCIQPVAVEPSTTGDGSDYIFVGTNDRRLLRCRDAQILQVLHLDAVPSLLHFGVVAGGQGVLLVVLDDSQQKVVAVCPESLEILQDWSKVWRVVFGDFTSSGHDQIILLQIAPGLSSEGLCTPIDQRELQFTVLHGFTAVSCEGLQQGSQQHLAETKAINDCKVSGMETICKALQARVEAGLEQLQVAKNEGDSKKELVRISSCLMQSLITRCAFEQSTSESVEGNAGSDSFSRQDKLQMVRATKAWNRVCGMNWFFMVQIEMTAHARPDAALQNVSLLLTSLNCSIGGKSSVLKSFSLADKRANLVVCVPYQDLSLRPGLPFNVSVRASMFGNGETLRPSENSDSTTPKAGDVYTQWLGCSEVVYPTLTPNLQPEEACTVLEEVGEKVQFVVAAKSEEHLSHLSEYMQSTLRMQAVRNDENECKNKMTWFNLCSADGNGPYVAQLCYVDLHAIIKLRAADSELLAILEQTSVELFSQHQFEIVSRMIPNEAVEKLADFVKTLGKHLALQDSLMYKGHDNNSDRGRYVAQTLEKAVDEKFSKIWASLL